jgi:hypothetical protein
LKYNKFVVEPDFNIIEHGDCKKKESLDFYREINNALGLSTSQNLKI